MDVMALLPKQEGGQSSNRATAADDDRRTWCRREAVDGVEGDGERLDEGAISQWECVGERQDLSGWENHLLCKPAVAAFSDEAEVPAEVSSS